jgi:hypothetical protein
MTPLPSSWCHGTCPVCHYQNDCDEQQCAQCGMRLPEQDADPAHGKTRT